MAFYQKTKYFYNSALDPNGEKPFLTILILLGGVTAPQTVDIAESISEEKNMKTESYKTN